MGFEILVAAAVLLFSYDFTAVGDKLFLEILGQPDAVSGGDVAENAARMKALLEGRGTAAEQDIVILNTAALLQTAGLAPTLREGAALARDALASGGAGQVLAGFVEASRD